jgi:hypothetical protein
MKILRYFDDYYNTTTGWEKLYRRIKHLPFYAGEKGYAARVEELKRMLPYYVELQEVAARHGETYDVTSFHNHSVEVVAEIEKLRRWEKMEAKGQYRKLVKEMLETSLEEIDVQ